jgi:hypothetical protein
MGRGLASISALTSKYKKSAIEFDKLPSVDPQPPQVTHPKPDLWAIEKRETRVREMIEADTDLLRQLRERRREAEVDKTKVMLRKGPVPDLLSKMYRPQAKIDYEEAREKYVLPLPSYLNAPPQMPHSALPAPTRPANRRKKAFYYPPVPKFIPPSKLEPIIKNEEIDQMLIQKPVVIYWKRIKTVYGDLPNYYDD